MAKRETLQGEERTRNPSSRKDKKPRNSTRPKPVGDRLIQRPEKQERKPRTYGRPGKHVPRNRHKRQAARREEEDAHKRSTKAGTRSQESTPERRKPQHLEYRERGAQDEPTGKGT